MPPRPTAQFVSSSGRTAVQYFRYRSGIDGPPSFRDTISVDPGYAVAHVFLTGFTARSAAGPGLVAGIAIDVHGYSYHQATGALEVGVGCTLATTTPGPSEYEVTFVVVLTDPTLATVTPFSSSGRGRVPLADRHAAVGAVPPGQELVGIAVQEWQVRTSPDPVVVPLHRLSGHATSVAAHAPDVDVVYEAAIADAATTNGMSAEWRAFVVAFDPVEIAPGGNPASANPTFFFSGQTEARRWREWWSSRGRPSITGVLDMFQGAAFEVPPGEEYPVGVIEVSARNYSRSVLRPSEVASTYGLNVSEDPAGGPTFPFDAGVWRTLGFLL